MGPSRINFPSPDGPQCRSGHHGGGGRSMSAAFPRIGASARTTVLNRVLRASHRTPVSRNPRTRRSTTRARHTARTAITVSDSPRRSAPRSTAMPKTTRTRRATVMPAIRRHFLSRERCSPGSPTRSADPPAAGAMASSQSWATLAVFIEAERLGYAAPGPRASRSMGLFLSERWTTRRRIGSLHPFVELILS